MESAASFVGTDVYAGGKIIGRVSDLMIDTEQKKISGVACISNIGIIRGRFFVRADGIIHIDRNGIVVDKSKVRYKKSFGEEYASDFAVFGNESFLSGSVGEIYFDPLTLKIESVSVKHGFLDDLIFGREILSADDIAMTENGIIIDKSGI